MPHFVRFAALLLVLMGGGLEHVAAQQFTSDAKARPAIQTGTAYFCPPCSCDRDGAPFHEHGRCPACNMKLLEAGHFNNEHPILSPGGSTIAFLSTRDHNVEIYTMEPDGANLRRLTHHDNEDKHVSWSPDGTQILYTSYDKTTRTSDIYVMNADGSAARNLTRHASWNGLPVLSPDGRRITFQTNRGDNWDVYVMNADGSGLTRITHHEDYDGAPRWSEDGAQILFTSRRDGEPAHYAIDAGGNGPAQRIDSPADGVVSPDGTRLVYEELQDEERNADLFVRRVDGSGVVRLTETPGFDNTYPVWSPDGTRIYFTSDRDGQREIYAINADGSNARRVTFSDRPALDALLPLPPSLRATAAVMAYTPEGTLRTLRPGTSGVFCIADAPDDDRFSVACHPASMQRYLERARHLRATTSRTVSDSLLALEVRNGTLALPSGALSHFVSGAIDPQTGVPDSVTVWNELALPFAEPDATGLRTEDAGQAPYMMSAGRYEAHVMIDTRKIAWRELFE